MTAAPSSRQSLIKRLDGYWKMEAVNVLLVPFAIVLVTSAQLSWLTVFTFVPMMALLTIGAVYWKAKLEQIKGRAEIAPAVNAIAKWQMPMLVLTVLSVLVTATLWLEPELARGRTDQWVATGVTVLAALEYVNYYHRQLQHFDHVADWKRLLSGKGFRRSQLREDIDRLER